MKHDFSHFPPCSFLALDKKTAKKCTKSLKKFAYSRKSRTFAIPFKKDNTGELAEWSNAAVLKTVDLHGSGGSNPSLSAKRKEKSRQVCLNAIFCFVLCNAPPQAGRDVGAQRRNPRERGICSVSVSSGLSACKGPASSVKGCANVVSKSLPEKPLDRIMDQILKNWSTFFMPLFGRNLGHALMILMYAYDPSHIVLGGGIANALPLFRDAMVGYLMEKFPFKKNVENLVIDVRTSGGMPILGVSLI